MKKFVAIKLIFLLICLIITPLFSQTYAYSQDNNFFDKAKSGVVTILSSSRGSGFFIEESGLILTNYHVVDNQEGMLRVKLAPNKILNAQIVATEAKNDLAIIRINMDELKEKPYIFDINDTPVTKVGQQIIAIGSPINTSLEKTITQGIIGKINDKIIYHDAAVNGGNSGGPLIYLNGQVVGVNTFGEADRGQALCGAVNIKYAKNLLEKAKLKSQEMNPPSPDFVPDLTLKSYSYKIMNSLFKKEKDLRVTKLVEESRAFYVKNKYFDVMITTPLREYKYALATNSSLLDKQKARIQKGNRYIEEFNVAEEYIAPVVTVFIIPRPRLTKMSKINMGLLATIGSVGLAPYLCMMGRYKLYFKNDFDNAQLKTEDELLPAFLKGRMEFSENHHDSFYGDKLNICRLKERVNMGFFQYDYRFFETKDKLFLEVKNEEDKIIKISIPKKVKKEIQENFIPYKNSQ